MKTMKTMLMHYKWFVSVVEGGQYNEKNEQNVDENNENNENHVDAL